MADGCSDNISSVRAWVEKSGFGLELATAQAFMDAGFDVQQSSYFEDAESGDAREIDLIANDPDVYGALRIMYVVECKATKKGSWVMFVNSRSMTLGNRLMNFAVLSDGAFGAVADNIHEMIAQVRWFKKDPDLVAYALRRAHSADNSDPAFAASMSVTKACKAALGRAIEDPPSAVIAFPVIVVDTPILVCRLDDDGSVMLEEVDEFEYVFHGVRDQRVAPCIRVVHRESVETFALDARAAANEVRGVLANWTDEYARIQSAQIEEVEAEYRDRVEHAEAIRDGTKK